MHGSRAPNGGEGNREHVAKTADKMAFFDFARNQAAIRRHLRVTLEELQAALGISASDISAAERGSKPLGPDQQTAITNYLKQVLHAKLIAARRRPAEPQEEHDP